jgi:nucleoside-diphosphate-sugar epimerase
MTSAASSEAPHVCILGCGYSGLAITKQMITSGWRVTALTRNPDFAQRAEALGARGALAELQSEQWQASVTSPVDAVVYALSATDHDEAGYRLAYVSLQARLASWLKAVGCRRYVQLSSTGVYPDAGGRWLSESEASHKASASAAILLEAEAVARGFATDTCRVSSLRLGGIYGPGRATLLLQLQRSQGVLAGSGDHYLNSIHVADIATAVQATISQPGGLEGVYNVTDGSPMQKAELAASLGQLLGLKTVSFDPSARSHRSALRQGPGGRPPSRRLSTRRFREATGWRPAVANALVGYRNLLEADPQSDFC